MDRLTRIQTFARIGYLARGVVYVLLGYFALSTVGSQGTTGVLGQIREMPAGTILLALVGIGLAGWGVFRLYGAAIDLHGEGTDAKGIGKRIGHVCSGGAHLFLAWYALSSAFGRETSSGGGGNTEQQSADWILSLPFGEALLAIIGAGFLAAALSQLVKAWTAKFLYRMDAGAPDFAEYVGRAGYAARAVVFAVIGWQVGSAALSGHAGQVGGIGGVLDTLAQTQWLYILVAIGLLLFGIFSLVMARYRTIRDEDVIERLKAAAR